MTPHKPEKQAALCPCRHACLLLSGVWGQVGFQLLDELARREGIKIDKLQKKAAVGKGRLCGKRVVLAKPMTFMNVSGESVSALLHFYKVRSRAHQTLCF